MSREISRRAEKLARVISYSLDRSSLQDVLRSYGKAADEKLIDSALLHAFTLCRSRVVLHQRGIEREERIMQNIRESMTIPLHDLWEAVQ